MKNIQAEHLELGVNVFIAESASIRGIAGKAKKITIGDNVYIGDSVQIICDEFSIGDYGRVHHHTNIHGYLPCHIGHNAWIGQFSILDSIGGMEIGNNCGIGAHSQLWSHIKYGDTLEGCQFNSTKKMQIGEDVWFVGHCIVSPITAHDKSMALVGSVVTRDMQENSIYAGSPAVKLTGKMQRQFQPVPLAEKLNTMRAYLEKSGVDQRKIRIVETADEADMDNAAVTYFILSTRQYTKRSSPAEIDFMKFLLPEKAKFTPLV